MSTGTHSFSGSDLAYLLASCRPVCAQEESNAKKFTTANPRNSNLGLSTLAAISRLSSSVALCALASTFSFVTPAQAQDSASPMTDTIIVTGRRLPQLEEETEPVSGNATAADSAALVAHLPGAALINNGAVSGQVQYRGLFSERLAVRVGGQSFQSGM